MAASLIIIEQDADLGRLFEAMLTMEGHYVQIVASVDEGRRLLSGILPDLVIFDWSVADSEGTILIDELRQRPFDIPLLLVCGALPKQHTYEHRITEGVPIVEKPFDLTYFCRTILGMLVPRERAIAA